MSENIEASEEQGKFLLAEMEKTIPQKIAVCSAHLMLDDNSVVVDAGCADGIATAYFALENPNIHVIGIDYDAQFIAEANRKYGHIPNIEFIKDDLRTFDLKDRKVDAIVNLSILHEPYSYTGYRKRTVEEIIRSELKNLKPEGVIINRDFVLPENPKEMVYMAILDTPANGKTPQSPEEMSDCQLLQLYAKEAMSFDNSDPEGHIKGFFIEEHTNRFLKNETIPENWRVFYLPHEFAWEFTWRKEYKERFFPEANEKYGFWTHNQHKKIPEELGARVTFSANYENPWILKNWYEPKIKLFDKQLNSLPLPPSNFISVLQNIHGNESIEFREHRNINRERKYLELDSYINKSNGAHFDLVSRPGGDVVDVLPYSVVNDELIIYTKHNYPRPLVNTYPRMMTSNIDGKAWSGHVVEPLSAAPFDMDWQEAVYDVLTARASFTKDEIPSKTDLKPQLTYYTAPAELNERVSSAFVEVTSPRRHEKQLASTYSGFSSDGSIRSFNTASLLNAAQVGMLAEARLELNIYALYRALKRPLKPWIGTPITTIAQGKVEPTALDTIIAESKSYSVFEKTPERSNWLDIVSSEFHEIQLAEGRERILKKKVREFIIPNANRSDHTSTNSITIFCVVRQQQTNDTLVGIQKISPTRSQFPAIQVKEGHSGHITIPGYRLPVEIDHVQKIEKWLSDKINVPTNSIHKLGEGYFPSLGVMPNRVFPYIVTETSEEILDLCDFVKLEELYRKLDLLQDAHAMISILRAHHALMTGAKSV